MTYTLADCIQLVVAPYVAPALISPAALARICDIGQYIPNAITSGYGFECRLGQPEPTADFSFYIVAGTGRDVLAGAHSSAALDARLMRHPLWKRLQLFAQDWKNPESLFYPNLENVWLEFDIVLSRQEPSLPNFFFRPTFRHQSLKPSGHQYCALLDNLVTLLLERSVSPAVRRMLLKTIAELPEAGHIFQMGMLLVREVQCVRVCLRGIAPHEASAYLRRIGWEDGCGQFDALISRLSEYVDRIDLALDIDDSVLPRIGLESYLLDPKTTTPRQRRYLDWLEDARICLPEKRQALEAYPGYITNPGDRSSWPEHIRATSFLLGHHRWIHHIKINYLPSGAMEAKAYIGAHQTWIGIAEAGACRQQRDAGGLRSRLLRRRSSLFDV